MIGWKNHNKCLYLMYLDQGYLSSISSCPSIVPTEVTPNIAPCPLPQICCFQNNLDPNRVLVLVIS